MEGVMRYLVFVFLILFCSQVTTGLAQEQVTTTPLLYDGILYMASTEPVTRLGHLRAIDIMNPFSPILWDAAARIPLAGTTPEQPVVIETGQERRILFTNQNGELVPLEAAQATRLQSALGAATQTEAEILLHGVRGRQGGTADQVAGTSEASQRLGGISRSSPVLVDASPVGVAERQRDRVLYVGAEDGLLHAFHVSRFEAENDRYRQDDPDGGHELWGYLPGSFLPWLAEQQADTGIISPVIHVDGTPVVGEYFLAFDGDSQRRWRTLLVASGTMRGPRQSCLFVLDVSDPHQPKLLWEKSLPGEAVGRTRGVRIGACGRTDPCIYLTADYAPGQETAGLHAMALTLETGQKLWQFSTPYGGSGPVLGSTPAPPALLDQDGDHVADLLVFGDLVGRLWALHVDDGRALGNQPVFTVPGGADQPIGAGVAVYNRTVVFGTGGVTGTRDDLSYALYAVEISPQGSTLRWQYPLLQGEKVWAAPLFDNAGKLVFAASPGLPTADEDGSLTPIGRLVVLDQTGAETFVHQTASPVLGRVAATADAMIAVDRTGDVTQFGTATRDTGSLPDTLGRVHILSWRRL
jgi:Tfp pilus tip-associated adhesin PilY1